MEKNDIEISFCDEHFVPVDPAIHHVTLSRSWEGLEPIPAAFGPEASALDKSQLTAGLR